MKRLFFILLIVCGYAASAGEFTLNDVELSWSDFRQVAPFGQGNQAVAGVYTYININRQLKKTESGMQWVLTLSPVINRTNSFVIDKFLQSESPAKKQWVLKHEKGHVAITMIYLKKMANALLAAQQQRMSLRTLDSLCADYRQQMIRSQYDYDIATNHSDNIPEQNKWENLLLLQLNDLYKNNQTLPLSLQVSLNAAPLNEKKKDPLHYRYPPDLQPVFEDDFEDDRNSWLDDDDTSSLVQTTLQDGYLRIRNSDSTSWSSAIKKDIDFSRDYEIEIAFRIDSFPKRYYNAAAFSWGADSLKNAGAEIIYMDYAGSGYVKNCTGGDHSACTSKYFHYYIPNKKDFRIFTLRKTGDTYYVFVNDIFEKKITVTNQLPGGELHLGAMPNATISYDYIRVYYLDDGT